MQRCWGEGGCIEPILFVPPLKCPDDDSNSLNWISKMFEFDEIEKSFSSVCKYVLIVTIKIYMRFNLN